MSPMVDPIYPIFDLVAEPVNPAPYSVALSHSSAAAMAPAETEPDKEDRTLYIDCCVKYVYSFEGYFFARNIGVSTLVVAGILVAILVSPTETCAASRPSSARTHRSSGRTFM